MFWNCNALTNAILCELESCTEKSVDRRGGSLFRRNFVWVICGMEMRTLGIRGHPQIQKESQYIKYLCCDDRWLMHLWVTGIRIAKYGKTMYDNYNIAVQKAGLASRWSNPSNVESKASSGTAASSSGQPDFMSELMKAMNKKGNK
ncbi:UNVERIFIED_CONTAM: hypothetical protein FKN15_041940 [Acipenser sinensis]